MELMKDICGDLKEADDHLVSITQKTVSQRLAETIIYLENIFDIDQEGFIKTQLSRDDIAGMIGTATESCIRILSEFKKKDLIELSGKKIKIINQSGLKKLAE
jgi:CRP-like cAMP-binding protein